MRRGKGKMRVYLVFYVKIHGREAVAMQRIFVLNQTGEQAMQTTIGIKNYGNKDWVYVRCVGELDMAAADGFRRELMIALQQTQLRRLLLDMNGLSFIDSSGLGVILGRHRQLAALGGRVAITGANEAVYRLLVAGGLHRVMMIDPPQKSGEVSR